MCVTSYFLSLSLIPPYNSTTHPCFAPLRYFIPDPLTYNGANSRMPSLRNTVESPYQRLERLEICPSRPTLIVRSRRAPAGDRLSSQREPSAFGPRKQVKLTLLVLHDPHVDIPPHLLSLKWHHQVVRFVSELRHPGRRNGTEELGLIRCRRYFD